MSHGLLLAHRQSPSSPFQLYRYQLQLQNGLVKLIKNSSRVKILFQKRNSTKTCELLKLHEQLYFYFIGGLYFICCPKFFQESPQRKRLLKWMRCNKFHGTWYFLQRLHFIVFHAMLELWWSQWSLFREDL